MWVAASDGWNLNDVFFLMFFSQESLYHCDSVRRLNVQGTRLRELNSRVDKLPLPSLEELTIVWLLLITTVVITYVIQRYRLTWIPPSSCAMLLGVLAGGVSRLAGLSQLLRFSPAAFFYALLPPIVFAAGFTLKKRQFFKNFGAILMFAVVGTFISAIVFGLGTYLLVVIGVVKRSHLGASPLVECLMYGSAISSIDPVATLAVLNEVSVPPLLYNVVFGESVLNDAVAIVLFRSLSQFSGASFSWTTLPAVALQFVGLAFGSLVVGCGTALACAFTLKRFHRDSTLDPASPQHAQQGGGQQHSGDGTMYEMAIVVMGSYLAYLLAEVVGMSGIVALFFSGICHAHYSYYNVTRDCQVTLRKAFEFAAFMCETFVFAYLGIQVVTARHSWDLGLMLSGVPLCVISRAANVFPCSFLVNLGRRYPLPPNLQRMLWAVGLRGAVAYGLVVNLPRGDSSQDTGIPAIETATLFIVVVTTLGLGSATGPLLRKFDLEGRDDADLYGLNWEEGGLTHGMTQPGRPLNRIEFSQHSTLHDKFREVDRLYLKPLFGGRSGSSSADLRLAAGGESAARSYASLAELDGHSRRYSPSSTPARDPHPPPSKGDSRPGAGAFTVVTQAPPWSAPPAPEAAAPHAQRTAQQTQQGLWRSDGRGAGGGFEAFREGEGGGREPPLQDGAGVQLLSREGSYPIDSS